MGVTIIHVGLDVDDTQYHGSAFNKDSGEVIDFKCRPTLKGLLVQLRKVAKHFQGARSRSVTRRLMWATAFKGI